MLTKSKIIQLLLGLIISFGLIGWIYMTTDWAKVGDWMLKMNYWAFIPITAVTILHYYLRAWRWRYLLPEGEKVPVQRLFDSIMVGNFATFVLPFRAGEFVRPFLLSRLSAVSFTTGFVSVVVERFFDLAMVLLSFGIVGVYIKGLPVEAVLGAKALSVLALIILVVMVVGTFLPAAVLKLLDFCLHYGLGFLPQGFRGKIRKFAEDFLRGAAILNQWWRVLAVLGLSLCVWGSCYLISWAYFLPFHQVIGAWPAITIAVVIALAVAAPSAPGFIGVYQAACVAGMALFGMDTSLAVAYSIVCHVYQYIVFVVYGMYVLSKTGMKLGELRSR